MEYFNNFFLLFAPLALINFSSGRQIQDYALDRLRLAKAAAQEVSSNVVVEEEAYSTYRYYDNETASHLIKSMPAVHHPLEEMYGGLIPIDNNDITRQLYYIFKPAIDADVPGDELTIFLNGGPGCSSLGGFFQENGPFTWQPGTYLPVPNAYSWANITNMLWVDQPVGTGFTVGNITAKSEFDIAADFVKWFKNFQQTFGIKDYKIYVTGESCAGRYVPYISSAMLNQSALVYDPAIGNYDFTQGVVVTYPFIEKNNDTLNETFMTQQAALHKSCGYADLIDTYLQFPPPGNQPAVDYRFDKCDLIDDAYRALLEINPCFDIYEITQQCPLLWSVLSFPTGLLYHPEGAPKTYFDQIEVKEAIHAPLGVAWGICATHQVFVGTDPGPQLNHDDAPDPIQHVLPQVIEATNRVLVSNGDLDMIVITNGTLLSIQNMTWNGKLGFQEPPSEPIVIAMTDLQYNDTFHENAAFWGIYEGTDGSQGTMGIQHFERGLMWAETFLSGHMQPEFQGRVSLRHLQWLLGRIEKL